MREGPTSVSPERRDFLGYLTGSALWLAGFNLQQFLVIWLLVGVLEEPGTRVGIAQFVIAAPGLLMMLFGGALGDRADGRTLLVRVHLLAALPSLLLAAALYFTELTWGMVIAYGVAIALLNGLSEPPRYALLNRVSRADLQRSVVIVTTISAAIGLTGYVIGSRIESFGIAAVLLAQSLLFGLGAVGVLAIRGALTRTAGAEATTSAPSLGARRRELAEGFARVLALPLIRSVIGLNFFSSVFNAGAWWVVYPLLLTRVYDADATLLATLILVFLAGSIASNLLMLRFVPLVRPGRLFLLMQVTRMVLFSILMFAPPLWLVVLASIGWGMNMGVTVSTTRMMVQQEAPEAHRARILSIYLLSTMVSMPLGSIVLGPLVDLVGIQGGFAPGLIASGTILLIGLTATGLWQHRATST